MKTLKKQLSILLAVLMLAGAFAVVPIGASAEDSYPPDTEATTDENAPTINPELLDSFIESVNTVFFDNTETKITKDNYNDYITVYKTDDKKIIFKADVVPDKPTNMYIDGYMFMSDTGTSTDEIRNYAGFSIFYPDKKSKSYSGIVSFPAAVQNGIIELGELVDAVPGAKRMTEQDYIELFKKNHIDVTKVVELGDLLYAVDDKEPEQGEKDIDIIQGVKIHLNSYASPNKLGLFYISREKVYRVDRESYMLIDTKSFIDSIRRAEAEGVKFNFTAEYEFGDKAEECLRLIKEKYPTDNFVIQNYCEIDDYCLFEATNGIKEEMCYHVPVGNYLIYCYYINHPYDIGYYIVKDGKCYTLEEAYDQKVIDDEDMDKINEKMNRDNNYKLSPIEKQFIAEKETSREIYYYENKKVLTDLGEVDGYKVLSSYNSEGEGIVNYGDYAITRENRSDKQPLCVYLYKDGEFTTIEQAWSDGVINNDNIGDVVELLKKDSEYIIKDKNSTEPTTEKVEYKDIADVVPSDAETKTLRFYMPEDWKTTYSETYDGKELSSCVPGIYWWEGSYNCDDYYGKEKAWPGYYISKTEEADSNIFAAEVPKDVKQIMFNNMVKIENNDYEQNPDRYNASVKTSLITAEGYQSGEDIYEFYPDGLDTVEDMIFVPYKSDIVELDRVDNGEWFYYYGDGKYGVYKTLAEAEANDAVYSGGQFPENNNGCEQPEETEVTEPTTEAVEPTTAEPTTEVTEPTTAEPTTEVTEPTTVEPTTEKAEPTTINTATQPSKAAALVKAENKKTVKPAVKANPIKVTAKAKTVKAKKLAKKARKIKAITVKNAVGKVTYKLAGAPKKIKKLVKINKKGVITFKKGKYAKKTYKIKVKVTAAGNKEFTSAEKTVTVKVKVK